MFKEDRRFGDNHTGPKLIGWPATITSVVFIVLLTCAAYEVLQ